MSLRGPTYLHYHVHQPSFTFLLPGQACNEVSEMIRADEFERTIDGVDILLKDGTIPFALHLS